jgi:hypothetical protein
MIVHETSINTLIERTILTALAARRKNTSRGCGAPRRVVKCLPRT